MSDDYNRLLDSTIDHLQSLKLQGTRFLNVEAETLALLQRTAPANVLKGREFSLTTGETRDISFIQRSLTEYGYERVEQVELGDTGGATGFEHKVTIVYERRNDDQARGTPDHR